MKRFDLYRRLALFSLIVCTAGLAWAQGTIPDAVSQNVNIAGIIQMGVGILGTWLVNQGAKSRSPFFRKFLPILSPFVGSAIVGAYAGAAGGITGSGHIGADMGHGALNGLLAGALSVFGHEAVGQHVEAGLSAPATPPQL